MGFSGGGANILKPHTHDSNILQDGGSLDFDNITQSSMAASSMTYSDGAHLQELSIGSAGDTLSVTGGVPTWSPHGDYPVMLLLATYTGSNSSENIAISPAVDLTEYSEVIVITNLFTNSATGFGEIVLYPNGSGGTFTNSYGYSIDTSPAITAATIASTNRHILASAAMTAANSGFHSETHISLAKTATTTNTVYLKTDSISNQNRSEHWESTLDLTTVSLSSVQVAATAANWGLGTNISIYGIKHG